MVECPEQDVLQLLNRAFLFLDERRYEALAELFAPDGRWQRQGRLLRGRAAVVAALAERSETMRICHVITNGITGSTAADKAEAQCVMTAYRYDDGTVVQSPPTIAGPAVMARVRARLLRQPEGWRIEEMTMDYLFHFAAPVHAAA